MAEKRVIAKSKAEYRGFLIMEVGKDCFVLFEGTKRHDFLTFGEATAFVDAYHLLQKRLLVAA